MHRLAATFALAPLLLHAADPLYDSARRKLDLIETHRAKPGAVFNFTPAEVNAWARVRVPDYIPQGVREPRVELGNGSAIGYGLVDLMKVRPSSEQNWLVSKLIEGERPMAIAIQLSSGTGRCTVNLTRVEVASVVASGSVLDFLIKTFFMPLYPDAKINEPFDLDNNIDRIDLRTTGITVTMKK